jgi:hypothetical protein
MLEMNEQEYIAIVSKMKSYQTPRFYVGQTTEKKNDEVITEWTVNCFDGNLAKRIGFETQYGIATEKEAKEKCEALDKANPRKRIEDFQ